MKTEEQIRKDFAAWIESMPKPNEYNRMYGHHLTSFTEGFKSGQEAFKSALRKEIEYSIVNIAVPTDDFAKGYDDAIEKVLKAIDSVIPNK